MLQLFTRKLPYLDLSFYLVIFFSRRWAARRLILPQTLVPFSGPHPPLPLPLPSHPILIPIFAPCSLHNTNITAPIKMLQETKLPLRFFTLTFRILVVFTAIFFFLLLPRAAVAFGTIEKKLGMCVALAFIFILYLFREWGLYDDGAPVFVVLRTIYRCVSCNSGKTSKSNERGRNVFAAREREKVRKKTTFISVLYKRQCKLWNRFGMTRW